MNTHSLNTQPAASGTVQNAPSPYTSTWHDATLEAVPKQAAHSAPVDQVPDLSAIGLAVLMVCLAVAVWRMFLAAPPLPPRDQWESTF